MKNNGYLTKKLYFYNFFFRFFVFSTIFKSFQGCEFKTPIRKNGVCVLEYCSENDFKNSLCSVENEIVETQWITNIIWVGGKTFRYVNFASFSTGEIILETTAFYPGNAQRIFYGLQATGDYSFINEGVPTPLYSQNVSNHENGNVRYEAEIFIAKNQADNKEYLLSLPGSSYYLEIYDFKNQEIYYKKASDILGGKMTSYRQSAINYTKSDEESYIIFCYSVSAGDDKYSFIVSKFQLTSLSNDGFQRIGNIYNKTDVIGNSTSCFLAINSKIICMYLERNDTGSIFNIIALNSDLNLEGSKTISSPSFYGRAFIKCILYDSTAGIFTYYSANEGEPFPNIQFLEYYPYQKQFIDYFGTIKTIILRKSFNYDCLLNDIIKISTYKICYIAPSIDKEELYVVILNVFGKERVIIRYYNIRLFALHNYKILLDIRGHLYNNFIAFAFSFCQQSSCSNDRTDEHYSGFMIFSYPNITDTSINLKEYLFEKNIDIDDFEIKLSEFVKIENNIFGYKYSGIKILEKNNCSSINLYSSLSETEIIEINKILAKNENIKIGFYGSNFYFEFNCTLKYSYIITEPDFSEHNDYINYTDETYGEDVQSYYNNQIDKYEGRIGYFNIFNEENLDKICENSDCLLCNINFHKQCYVCKSNFTYGTINSETYKNCGEEVETTILTTEYTTQLASSELQIIEKNTEDTTTEKLTEVMTQKTSEENESEIKKLFNELKENLLSGNYSEENNIIIKDNIIIQISTVEEQKNSNNTNVSSIDLGECEDILKTKYEILYNESILIIKLDVKSKDSAYTYVQYELYHPNNKTQLNLDYCSKVGIYINIPVDLSSDTILLYDSLNESGHNLFDTNDSFYNDICVTYTSKNGTDMLLEDRQNDIYSAYGNISACQTGCEPESYNKTTKKVQCNCNIQKEETNFNITKILSDLNPRIIKDALFTVIKNSNFMVMQCYELAFSTDDIFKNIGRIIMTLIYFIFITMIFIFSFKNKVNINKFLNQILLSKMIYNDKQLGKNKNEIENRKGHYLKDLKRYNEKKYEKIGDFENEKNYHKVTEIGKLNKLKDHNNKVKHKDKRRYNTSNKRDRSRKTTKITKFKINKTTDVMNYKISNDSNHFPPKKRNNNALKVKLSNENDNKSSKYTSNNSNRILSENNNIKINNKMTLIDINIYQNKNLNKKKVRIKEDNKIKKEYQKDDYNNQIMNDQELNSLSYEKAIKYDKRTYLIYYWSLLKKKHLLLFTFYPQKDYNLFTLKISLFLLSFSLYFTINGFFFSDNTMHKIYEDHGKYDLIFQIPQILYSSIISAILNIILKLLSLSEKNILHLKKEEDYKIAKKQAKKIKNYLMIKFLIFFILSNFLLLFYWYFITCFCAVYPNTQIILIKDTLISFVLSMIYPFGLNLLPGIFRIPALKAKKKDKKFFFQISSLLALI